ncbi:membrane-spanning 4-domains subfamily A member 12-like [Pempheris klunzingeri]|uniref:membrane-spanning 4-domains subfamily A member 12-like n=1 Tax=Pempheris klunzingeri TaxID=3127111 RepID=UPI00397FDF8D
MSVSVVKDKGATVITVTADSKSMLPPLCQILKALCYSPICCSVRGGLMQSSAVSALGTVQIMVGLFNIGLGPGRLRRHPEDLTDLNAAYWLGALFLAAGIVSVFADRLPSRCAVGFAVVFNVVGSIFAVIGIVLYAIDLGDAPFTYMCDNSSYSNDNCRYLAYIAQRLLTGMDITLIVLAAFQLCVCISLAVLGIKALRLSWRKDMGGRDAEIDQPLLKEVLMTSPGA